MGKELLCIHGGGPLKCEFIFGRQKQLCEYLISESTTMFLKKVGCVRCKEKKNNVMICKTLEVHK